MTKVVPWLVCLAFGITQLPIVSAQSSGNRVLGLDVAAWQGNISQTTWNNLRTNDNRQFVFIRATRGGTTGVDEQAGGYPFGSNTQTLSQRYDDPYFIQNINRATTAGMFAGSYHFARPDIIATTPTAGGIANTAIDEANHYIQMAGQFMRPGYLLPTFDLEVGDTIRTDNELAQYAIDFSNRVYDVMKIRPQIYLNGNYAQNVLGAANVTLRNQLAQPVGTGPNLNGPAYTQFWSARYATNPNIQTDHPNTSISTVYGPWDDYGNSQPWTFWQYTASGRLNSFNGGATDLDLNVAQGGIEFLKDQLVPAVWMNDLNGDWSTLANWNSGQTPSTPVSSPGQLTPIGTQTLPTPRLPGAAGTGPTAGSNDTVILDRPTADITITLSSGTHNIRKLYAREALNITGGSLTINYVPVAESTPMSAQFSAAVSISGGAILNAHTIFVDAARTFTANNAELTFDTLRLDRGTTAAKLALNGNITVTGLNGGTAKIQTNTGSTATGHIDLGNGTRIITVNNGAANVDLDIAVPVINGGLNKSGLGTMALSGANTYVGPTTVNQGKMVVSGSLAATAVVVNGGAILGGTGSIAGTVNVAAGTTSTARGAIDLGDGAIGTLRLTNASTTATVLSLGGSTGNSSVLNFEIGTTADKIQIDAGKIDVQTGGGEITISALPGFTSGTYDLITFANGQATGLNRLSLITTSLNGYSLTLQESSTALQIVVVPEPTVLIGLMTMGLFGIRLLKGRH